MAFRFNPFTGTLDVTLSGGGFLRLDTSNDPLTNDLEGKDFIRTRDVSISYSNGKISSVTKDGGRTLSVTRNEYGYISYIDDGSRTWEFSYNSDNTTMSGWTIT